MFRRSVKVGLKFQHLLRGTENIKSKEDINVFKRSLSSAVNLKPDVTHEEMQSFAINIFPKFAKDLWESPICEYYPDLKMRYLRMIEYPSKVGNKQVPCTTVMCYRILEKPEKMTEENVNLAYLLGWFGEMLQAVVIMASDVIEVVDSRNNTTTWHNQEDVGLQVANDTCVLQNSVLLLLRKYFKNHQNYVQFLELIHESLSFSFNGYTHELISKDVDKFNMDLIQRIGKYKIAPINYNMPFMSAVYITGLQDSKDLEAIKNILNDLAELKKVKTDFLDSFDENPKHLNIKHGYCSWLAVKLLENGDNLQRDILKNNYGKPEKKSIDKIHSLYKDLNLSFEFEKYKVQKVANIKKKIEELNEELFKECLLKILEQNV